VDGARQRAPCGVRGCLCASHAAPCHWLGRAAHGPTATLSAIRHAALLLLALSLAWPAGSGAAVPPRVAPTPPFPTPDSPPRPLGPVPPLGALPLPAAGGRSQDIARLARPTRALQRALSDGDVLVNLGDPRLRDAALDRARSVGVTLVRAPLSWLRIERGTPVDATDPDDPAYDFARVDALVEGASARGLDVMLTSVEAAGAHEAQPRWRFARPGTWAPRADDLARFEVAAARRYDGTHRDAAGVLLPRVWHFQIWNEPNLPKYLSPQWVVRDGRWEPFAAEQYRDMLAASYTALKALDPRIVVVAAGTAPSGEQRAGEGRMTPVRFYRRLLCVDGTRCPQPVRADAFSHHPLSVQDPRKLSGQPQDVAISELGRVRHLLAVAHARGTLASEPQLEVTELNWDSDPARVSTVKPARLARYVSSGLYLLWRQGVTLVSWQFVRDPITRAGARPHPAGLWRIDQAAPADPARDVPKEAVRAFAQPFVALRRRGVVRLWGQLRRTGTTQATIEWRRAGRWTPLMRVAVGRDGLLDASRRVPPGTQRLRLLDTRDGYASAASTVSRAPSELP
jgi:hypothetical protein